MPARVFTAVGAVPMHPVKFNPPVRPIEINRPMEFNRVVGFKIQGSRCHRKLSQGILNLQS